MALVTDFSTTNPDTVENVIQVGEVVTLNIIMYLPEVQIAAINSVCLTSNSVLIA